MTGRTAGLVVSTTPRVMNRNAGRLNAYDTSERIDWNRMSPAKEWPLQSVYHHSSRNAFSVSTRGSQILGSSKKRRKVMSSSKTSALIMGSILKRQMLMMECRRARRSKT